MGHAFCLDCQRTTTLARRQMLLHHAAFARGQRAQNIQGNIFFDVRFGAHGSFTFKLANSSFNLDRAKRARV